MPTPIRALAVLALLTGPGAGACEDAGVAAVTEIAPGVYVRAGRPGVVFEATDVANVSFVVGARCAAVIDTGGSAAEGRALERALRRVTDLPVCYVIDTHMHPDHVLGNAVFAAAGARVVGHRKLARGLGQRAQTYLDRASAQAGQPLGRDTLVTPSIEVTDRLDLDLGERTLELTAHSSAHTDNDLTVYDPQTRTLWLGDLAFLEHVPVLEGSLNGWLDVLHELADTSADRAVPGHGPASIPWPGGAADTLRYLAALRDDVRRSLAAGENLSGAQERAGYTEAGRWRLFESYHRRNVAAAYAELEWEGE